jgi:hypothetical protein
MADPVVRLTANLTPDVALKRQNSGRRHGRRDGVVPNANDVRLTIDAPRSFHASRSLIPQLGPPAGP